MAQADTGDISQGPVATPPQFSVRCDRSQRHLFTSVAGFWDKAVARRLYDATADAVSGVNAQSIAFTALADMRNALVQSSDVAPVNQMLIDFLIGSAMTRCAMIVPSALVKLQLRRQIQDDRFRWFETDREALAWLDGSG